MNAVTSFITRDCPACGAKAGTAEASSETRAETLSLERLRPYAPGGMGRALVDILDRREANNTIAMLNRLRSAGPLA